MRQRLSIRETYGKLPPNAKKPFRIFLTVYCSYLVLLLLAFFFQHYLAILHDRPMTPTIVIAMFLLIGIGQLAFRCIASIVEENQDKKNTTN